MENFNINYIFQYFVKMNLTRQHWHKRQQLKKWTRRCMPHSGIRRLEQLAIQPIARNVLFRHLRLISAGQWTLASACLGCQSVALEEQLTSSYKGAIGRSAPQIFFCFPKFLFTRKLCFKDMLKIFPCPQCILLPQTLKSDQWLLASVATLVVSKLLLVILLTQFQAGAFSLGKVYRAPRFR